MKKFLSNSSIKSGKQLKSDGDYPSAISAFTKSIKRKPENLEAYYQLGLIFEDVIHDYDKAISLYKNIVDLTKGSKPTGTEDELNAFNSLITNAKTSIDRAIKKKFDSIEKPKISVYIMVKPNKKILNKPEMFSASKYKTTSYASEFKLLNFSNNWYQVNVPSIGSGWINGRNVLKIIQKEKEAIKTSLAGKVALYERFVELYPESRFATDAKNKSNSISFELAKNENTINSYSIYLKKYPDGNYSKKAQLKKEELTFEDESFLNNIGKLKQWIASSPESTFTEKAKKRIEELAFAQAKYDNNTVSLEGYIIDYPDGEFVSEAKQLLEVIKIEQAEKNIEKLAFGDAKTKDTINAYKEFIVKYPDSHLNTMAKGILEAKYFENASRNGTVEAYKEFIEHYPDGSHMKEARLMIDKHNFELYKKKDRISDFEKFIKKYPDNRYVGNARVRIDQLNLEYQQKKNTLKTNEEFVNKYPKNRDINEAKQKIIILQTSNIEEESDSGFPFLLTVIIFSGVGIAIASVLMRKRVVSMVQSRQQQGKKSNINADIDKPPIVASTPSPTTDSISEEAQRVYEQGLRLHKNGQKREAIDAFHKATEIDPNCVDACVALARGYHLVDPQKYYDELAHFAELAFRAAPDNPKARNIQSVAHSVKGKMESDMKNWHEATLCFKQSYQIEPNQQTLASFGHCAEEAGELWIFADACEVRLKEQPDDHRVRFMLGRTLVNMAIKDPSDPTKNWRNTEYLREYLRRAEEQLTTFLSIDSVSADGNYWMGIIFSLTDRLDEAANIVAKLKNIDSELSNDLTDFIHSTTPLPPTDIGSQVDRNPDNIPVAELMRICQDNPKEGISLIDSMSNETQQTDCIVLSKFYAYQTAVSKPFIEAKIPLSSTPEEFTRGSQSDTIELCEKALEQILKFESGNVAFTMWEKDNFKKGNPDINTDDKTRADAVCTILDRLQPGRVQEILGRTKLSFFGGTRIGSVPGLKVNEIVGPKSISCLQDILFTFPKVIRSLIAFEVKEQEEHGFNIVSSRVFEQVTSKRPEEDPGQCLGILNLCEDGTCSYDVF
ncbi:MAG: tetratricopeptide repeat protein [Candidatus Scalindua sp.]|nr:tetratricopeptide repeat protein [Candidatus Scalindua sp.]